MKKFTVLTLAALMVVAFTIPAWALETEFGGYWRTRAWTQQNFSGEDDTEQYDVMAVDTRTRLYFTTIFHENLKFVNKFEFDGTWGSVEGARGNSTGGTYTDIGADGANIEIKNSYADFNLGPVNFKVGVQPYAFGRGFLFDDDFAGAVVTYKNDAFSIPVVWVKAYEGGPGKDANDLDADYFGINPSFNLGGVSINPFFMYVYSDEMTALDDGTPGWGTVPAAHEVNLWYAGMNIDMNFDPASIWLTGIYQGGDKDSGDVEDFKAWLAAAGGSVNLPFGNIHGQAFYATGDDDPADNEIETFFVPAGQSYYWSEIMGYGLFGDTSYRSNTANNFHGDDNIGNIMAANLGVTIKPMDKLSITLDAWYAALAEDVMVNGSEENYIGTEVDLKITYQLVQGLSLDIVGAYLFAGEVIETKPNEADPYEVGTRLSLSF